jgi:galactokinase/mevalonate kinase-like predicted kinase
MREKRDDVVMSWKVKAPLRVDLSGGWTDAPPFTEQHVGSLVNFAIDKFQVYDGSEVKCDWLGMGLGTSGAYNVIKAITDEGLRDRGKILVRAYQRELQENVCGMQDMAASTYGGLNYWEFYKDNFYRTAIPLTEELKRGLQDLAVLVNTGKSRSPRQFFVYASYPYVEPILVKLSEIATRMRDELLSDNMPRVRQLVRDTWYWQSRIPTVSTPAIEKLISMADAGKVCGAGGGGCVLLLFENEKALKEFTEKHKDVISFKIWGKGVESSEGEL